MGAKINRPPVPGIDFEPFRRWFPWLIPLFVVVDVGLFVVTMYINNCPKHSFTCFGGFLGRFAFQPLEENPLLGPSSATLGKLGALEVNKVVHQHQEWRLITSIWVHAGVVHLLANMISLLFIGIRLEREFGFVKIGLLYIISGFGANILSSLFLQSTISVGASGALFGLLGAMLSELLTNWAIYANKCAALLTLTLIIVINLAMGILPHMDNFAHIGGFITGFLLGFILLIRPQFEWVSRKHALPGYIPRPNKSKHKTYQHVLWVTSAVLLIAGITVGLVMVFRGVKASDYCSWCHYLSCVPTRVWSCTPQGPQQVFCQSIQWEDKLNLTCLSNGRSHVYAQLKNDAQLDQQLCTELCS